MRLQLKPLAPSGGIKLYLDLKARIRQPMRFNFLNEPVHGWKLFKAAEMRQDR